jgi:hypothetical protein
MKRKYKPFDIVDTIEGRCLVRDYSTKDYYELVLLEPNPKYDGSPILYLREKFIKGVHKLEALAERDKLIDELIGALRVVEAHPGKRHNVGKLIDRAEAMRGGKG